MIIYHITNAQRWTDENTTQNYWQPLLDEIGFIHCCTKEQIPFVLDRWFAGQSDLIILSINTKNLDHELKFENSEGGEEEFPHVYGPINKSAIVEINPIN